MKAPTVLLLALAATMASAAESSRVPTERPRLSREAMASVEKTEPHVQPKPTDQVTMAPFEVPAGRLPRERSNAEQTPAERRFEVQEGGTIAKHATGSSVAAVKFQYNAEHAGWDMLSLAW